MSGANRSVGQEVNLPVDGRVSVSKVSHHFVNNRESVTALDRVSFSVEPGEFVSIVGPSGCGKTTLLRVLGGLLRPTAGDIKVDGLNPREAQERRSIGFVFQQPALVPWRTVWQNLRLPFELGAERKPVLDTDVGQLLDFTGLANFRNYYPFQLSIGMQQRVALARALAMTPPLLLMDEPFSSLDEIVRSAVQNELLEIWGLTRSTVIFVTHSISEAIHLSDRILVLSGSDHRLQAEVHVDLPRPRRQEIEDSEEFLSYKKELRSLLKDGKDG